MASKTPITTNSPIPKITRAAMPMAFNMIAVPYPVEG
jgi:hypothetical protein